MRKSSMQLGAILWFMLVGGVFIGFTNVKDDGKLLEIHKGDSTKAFVGLTVDQEHELYAFNEFRFNQGQLKYNTTIQLNNPRRAIKFESRLFCLAVADDNSIVVYDSSHIFRLNEDGEFLDSVTIPVQDPYHAKVHGGMMYINENRERIIRINLATYRIDTIVDSNALSVYFDTVQSTRSKIEDFAISGTELTIVATVRRNQAAQSNLFKWDIRSAHPPTVCELNIDGASTYLKSPLIAANKKGELFLAIEQDSGSIIYLLNRRGKAVPIYCLPSLEMEQFYVLNQKELIFSGVNKKRRFFEYKSEDIRSYPKSMYSWISIYSLKV